MATLVLLVFLCVTLVYQGLTYLLWLYEGRAHGDARAAVTRIPYATAWIAEWLSLLFCLIASVLGAFRRSQPQPCVGPRPVALLHGWGMSRGSMAVLAARLRRDGRDACAVGYPMFGADLERKAACVAAALHEIVSASGADRVDVIAHSQGGILLRAAASRHGCLSLLGNVVTLGTPHRGTMLAAMVRWRSLAQLRPGSSYLERLAANDPVAEAIHFTSIYSKFDAIVFPAELSCYRGALNVSIDWVGHHRLLISEQVYQLAKENIDFEPKATDLA